MSKTLYKQAYTHYQLGEYSEAIKDYKEAYRLKPDPTFLFNIAQCHRHLRENEEAVRLYKSYLREAPDAPNHDDVERLIREIKVAIEQEQQSKSASAAVATAATSGEPMASATPPAGTPGAPPSLSPSESSPSPSTEALPARSTKTVDPFEKASSATASPIALLPSPAPVLTPAPVRGELEVLTYPTEANVLLNRMSVGGQSPVKLTLPPGLYSVAVEREGYRSVGGTIPLLAGDRVSVTGELTPVETHGLRGLGHAFVILGVLGEAVGIIAHVQANKKLTGSKDFENISEVEKVGHTVAISSAILAIGCYVLDWLGNRDRIEPGSPLPLTRVLR